MRKGKKSRSKKTPTQVASSSLPPRRDFWKSRAWKIPAWKQVVMEGVIWPTHIDVTVSFFFFFFCFGKWPKDPSSNWDSYLKGLFKAASVTNSAWKHLMQHVTRPPCTNITFSSSGKWSKVASGNWGSYPMRLLKAASVTNSHLKTFRGTCHQTTTTH